MINVRTVRQHPIVIAFSAFWLLEAAMNARFGLQRGGPGLAAVFIAFAFVAAWLPVKIKTMWQRRSSAEAGIAVCAFPAIGLAACVIVSQVACWATLGTMLADGQVKRQTQATQHQVAGDKLERLRAERAAIGTVRAVAAIAAEEALECSKTSPRYPDGVGPKCTALRAELATATRAVELERLIEAQTGELVSAPVVAGGSPDVAVLQALFGGEPKDITFWFTVVLASFIGFFANFGFALAGVGDPPPRQDDYDNWDWGPVRLPPPRPDDPSGSRGAGREEPEADVYIVESAAKARRQHEYPAERSGTAREASSTHEGDGTTVGAIPGAHARGQPEARHAYSGGPATSAPVMHGAPIHITLNAPSPGSPGGDRGTLGPASGADAPASTPPVPAPPKRPAARALHVVDVPATDAPDAPCNRDPIRTLTDRLLVFQASCLVSRPGGAVGGDELYQRYVEWEGERAEPREAFDALFGSVTGLQRTVIGGAVTWRDVALKRQRQLALAAGD